YIFTISGGARIVSTDPPTDISIRHGFLGIAIVSEPALCHFLHPVKVLPIQCSPLCRFSFLQRLLFLRINQENQSQNSAPKGRCSIQLSYGRSRQ
ncbi:MAG: hypothetical protein OXE41_01215, partial [Gammaproteobacteria bacterium]|nr:hypothetical protein [Gammaproteobacteria bacterium]